MKKMNIIALLGIFIAAWTINLNAQDKAITLLSKNEKSHAVQWEATTLELGTVNYQQPVEVQFKFSNKSAAPVLITKVKASCGCTATSYPTEPVAPGETALIKAKYSAASKGQFHKTIVVTTNSEPATQILTLNGTVE